MNHNADSAAALNHAQATFRNPTASAGELKDAAEATRAVVREIDEANEAAPKRRVAVLASMNRLADMIALLEAIDVENRTRALQREVAVAVAAALDGRARDAAQAEAARDEARKPFTAQTKKASELAKRIAEYPALAAAIVGLLRTDVLVARFGSIAYSRVPVRGSHVSYERTIRLPRMLATQERLTATRLLGYWPPRHNDFSILEGQYYHDTDRDPIAGPIYELGQKDAVSDEAVDRALARAQAALVSEYNRICAAIGELLDLDDKVSPADRAARYPDGALIFDSALYPQHWLPGVMGKAFNGFARIALPSIFSPAMAAE
jgi:cell division protein ZapA (FtsZ GTPase activity inhibitor)